MENNKQQIKKLPGGFFLTLEGPDGSGKSTQAALVAEILRTEGYDVVTTREPGGTGLAEKIRALLLNPHEKLSPRAEALLYLAARAEHVDTIIQPALNQGKIVVCDRFNHSTLVYQGYARENVDVLQLDHINDYASNNLIPDYTILLDADPAVLLPRRQQRDANDKYEKFGLAFQEKIRNGFQKVAKEWYPVRTKSIDAARPAEAVLQDIINTIRPKLEAILLWSDFGQIPVDASDNIEEPWRHFPKGTPKTDVWQWFAKTYNIDVAKELMWR